ncbi:MAG: carbon-nitrogen hydrolase family protein [Planctomycetota bacterium]
MTELRIALVQANSGNELAPNLAFLAQAVRAASAAGARLVLTPENTAMAGADRADTLAKASPEASHPGLQVGRDLARELGIWILLGSLQVRVDADQCANRSFLVDSCGEVVARYDKIHMFDARLPSGVYDESHTFRPGDAAVVAPTPWGKLGMSICYDLRFPQLYRSLARGGATLLAVPSSFTVPTGQAHWQVLLRARAIENGCFVLAPAQVGLHANGRRTYGHSLVVSPWGEVLLDAGDAGPGTFTVDLDLAEVARARHALPSLQHDRPYRS